MLKLLFFVLACFVFTVGCNEDEINGWKVEYFGAKKVAIFEIGPPDSFVKLEFNNGEKLSSVYWQKNSWSGYLYDFRSDKLFIDAPSVAFSGNQDDFYESLDRKLDIEGIKNCLTADILKQFCEVLEKVGQKITNKPRLLSDVRRAAKRLSEINLQKWHAAVDAEKNKIHVLGLEYCINESDAEKMLCLADFNLSYRSILGQKSSKEPLVICLGENHPEDSDKEEAIRLLEEAKPFGFKYFLLECVLFSDQEILDDYRPDDVDSEKALENYLIENGWTDSLKIGGKGARAYLEVIKKAKELGFKVFGIGQRHRDDIEFLRSYYYMALEVVKVLKKDPFARIICLTGPTHAFQNYLQESDVIFEGYLMRQDIPHIVKNRTGVDVFTFECIGGTPDTTFRKYLNPKKILEKHIENRGLAGRRFFIPISPEISTLAEESRGKYFYIHLPQKTGK